MPLGNVFKPHKARHLRRKDHWQFFVLGLATIYEGLVITLSLGYYTVETRAFVLFDLMEDDNG